MASVGQQSLAITETGAARPVAGGCAGSFFQQLLEWNRRFASKKKILSRKLLPPVKAVKWVSKKFNGNEKMPKSKILLIAEENHGVYPKARKTGKSAVENSGNGMQSPGLVARLMGLESMPIIDDRPRKALDSSPEESDKYSRLDQDLCGTLITETRPQKVQKTSNFLERRSSAAAVRFAADGLSKSLKSRSRRQQQRKLVTPLKSPRMPRSSARLMEVASKILDPKLHSKNQKNAISYVDNSLLIVSEKRSDVENLEDAFVGGCKNFGGLVEVAEVRFGTAEPVVAEPCSSSFKEFSSYSSCHTKTKEAEDQKWPAYVSSDCDVRDALLRAIQIQTKTNLQSRTQYISKGKCATQHVQDINKQEDGPSCSACRRNTNHNVLAMAKGKTVPMSGVYRKPQNRKEPGGIHKGKDVVSPQSNTNGNPHVRTSPKVAGGQRQNKEFDCERNTGRKRRPATSSPQVEHAIVGNSKSANLKNASRDFCNQKRRELASHVLIKGNSRYAECRIEGQGYTTSSSTRGNNVVSFAFSSPIKRQSTKFHSRKTEEAKSMDQVGRTGGASNLRTSLTKSKGGGSVARRRLALKKGELSNLRDQTIDKLTLLNQDQLAAKGVFPGTFTSSIFEGLSSPLTVDLPESQTSADSCSVEFSPTHDSNEYADVSSCSLSCDSMRTPYKKCEEETDNDKCTIYAASESNNHSPMSILEASFSNGSSFSEIYNGSTERDNCVQIEERDGSKIDISKLDNDILDSAMSINMESKSKDCFISRNFACNFKSESAKERFISVQLLLEAIAPYQSGQLTQDQVEKFLLGALETIMESCSIGPEESSEVTEIKKSNQLKELLVERMIEFLSSKYILFCKSACNSQSKLSLSLPKSWLTQQVFQELRGWRNVAGVDLNELVEIETQQSSDKWTECDIEVFDTGIEVESHILQLLIHEMVFEFC